MFNTSPTALLFAASRRLREAAQTFAGSDPVTDYAETDALHQAARDYDFVASFIDRNASRATVEITSDTIARIHAAPPAPPVQPKAVE